MTRQSSHNPKSFPDSYRMYSKTLPFKGSLESGTLESILLNTLEQDKEQTLPHALKKPHYFT